VINVHAASNLGQPLLQFCIQHPFGVILRNVKRLNNAAIPETVPVALCLLKFLEFLRRFISRLFIDLC